MAIKATVNDGKAKVEKPFPKLMVSRGAVMLAIEKSAGEITGVILSNGSDCDFNIGQYSECYRERFWHDFDGSVTLSNV